MDIKWEPLIYKGGPEDAKSGLNVIGKAGIAYTSDGEIRLKENGYYGFPWKLKLNSTAKYKLHNDLYVKVPIAIWAPLTESGLALKRMNLEPKSIWSLIL